MTSARSTLNEDERMEYNQIGDFYKHDDNMAYRFGSIILPTSLGAFGFSLKYSKIGLPLYTFSSILYIYWILFCERLRCYSKIRMSRARELEEKAGLGHHCRINEHDKLKCKWLKRKLKDCLSIRFQRSALLLVIVLYWGYCLGYWDWWQ